MESELFITVAETSRRLSCGVTLVYEHISKGYYRSVKLGKKRLIDPISLAAFAASLLESQSPEKEETNGH